MKVINEALEKLRIKKTEDQKEHVTSRAEVEKICLLLGKAMKEFHKKHNLSPANFAPAFLSCALTHSSAFLNCVHLDDFERAKADHIAMYDKALSIISEYKPMLVNLAQERK